MTVSNRLTGRFLILNGHGQKTMNRDEIKRDENGQNMNRDEIKRDENGQNMFDRRCLLSNWSHWLHLAVSSPPYKTTSTGSGCGSLGRVVASDTRDMWFESSHWQILFIINCIEKTKIKEKRCLEWQLRDEFFF